LLNMDYKLLTNNCKSPAPLVGWHTTPIPALWYTGHHGLWGSSDTERCRSLCRTYRYTIMSPINRLCRSFWQTIPRLSKCHHKGTRLQCTLPASQQGLVYERNFIRAGQRVSITAHPDQECSQTGLSHKNDPVCHLYQPAPTRTWYSTYRTAHREEAGQDIVIA
jgi:hypothetical protein